MARSKRYDNCIDCGEYLHIYGRDRCERCYRRWYNSSPERKKKHADQMRKWRHENPERAKAIEDRRSKTERRKEWVFRHNREYYAANAEQLREYQCQWRRSNPEQRDEYKRQYMARKATLPDTLTDEQWETVLESYDHACAYCETTERSLYEEHWIPVTKGGGRTIDNIVPSCARCNSRKGTMTGYEFLYQVSCGNIV